MNETVIVLAMHGAPARDYPRQELEIFFRLHAQIGRAKGDARVALKRQHDELDQKIRTWPRTDQNDPFHRASKELASHLSQTAGLDVILGYNEFCAPSLDEALDQAAQQAMRIVVVTPMMTQGGEHAEKDIPAAIRQTNEKYPDRTFVYNWPFPPAMVAQFLFEQMRPSLNFQSRA